MRKLVTLQRIAEIKPIEGADLIEAVRIQGWWCVSKKGEFNVGSPCLYFEVDSVLPMESRYEFLRKSSYVKKDWIEGYRLKTVRLKGQISQGLALPVDIFFPEPGRPTELGMDLTEVLGVKLWDPPVPAALAGQAKGNFPAFIPKTDQERIQNCYELFKEKYADDMFEASLKLDGSSCTLYVHWDDSGVCSRNLELKTGEENAGNTFVQIYHKYIDKIKKLDKNLAFQGELMGPGIQGNREKLTNHEWFIFDIYDIDAKEYLSSTDRIHLVKQIGLTHVPILLERKYPLRKTLKELLDDASETGSLVHKIAEGIVYKSKVDPSISFKVISNKFLLKESDG
jgi:RNA ligase (TIGR02306 family)